MKIGIIGKANVGKSTFFKALTLADVLIANYPFATIKPNIGCAYVRVEAVCKELGVQCTPRFGKCENGTRFVPVEILDVAGLVPGAHEGKGMGNQFLDDLRQADALIHIVDIAGTTNEKGEPIEAGSYDPAEDIRWLDIELDMWYYGILKKGWEKFARQIQQEKTKASRALAKQLSGLNVNETHVEDAIKKLQLSEKPAEWTEDQLKKLARAIRIQTKPMIIVANKADIQTAGENIKKCKTEFPEYKIIPASSESELALKEADKKGLIKYIPGASTYEIKAEPNEQQKKALEFIQKNVLGKLGSTGVQQALDTAVFEELKYFAVFPGGINNLKDSQGRILPDCFLMPPGSTAYNFAEKIHTDIAKRFIGAMDVKTKRKIGREHKLKHRDVIEILTRN